MKEVVSMGYIHYPNEQHINESDGFVFFITIFILLALAFYYLGYKKKLVFSEKYYQKVCFYLNQYEYFQKLSEENKKKFSSIIHKFNRRMTYHGMDGVVITEEIKIIVAAGYAKLSIGNSFGDFYTFRSIVIFPKAYSVEERKSKYLGKTSMQGYISLSWEDILKSEADLHDGVNLALHEFSHAIVVEMMQDQLNFELEYFMVRNIFMMAKHEIEKVNNGEEMHFRKYAYSSPHEFFAISVELFFEMPEKLISHSWRTYRNLCILFRQNPLKNEIGTINWEWILNYRQEGPSIVLTTETKKYGPFDFYPQEIYINVHSNDSVIEIFLNGASTKTYYFSHKDILYAAYKYIPPSQYTSAENKFILYFFRNNTIDNLVFSTTDEEIAKKMTEIYRKISLSN